MAQHELKTHPQAFRDVVEGRKPFEIRLNDRGFQAGDLLCLREYDPETETYTSNQHWVSVTFILTGGKYGLPDGYAVMAIAPRWPRDKAIRKLLATASADPGRYAGYKNERGIGEWMADAVVIALRSQGLLMPLPDDIAVARAQGRAEALALLMETDPETFPDNYQGSHSIADTGDYGAHWEIEPLRALLKADDSAWSLMQKAEGEYWAGVGDNDVLASLINQLTDVIAQQSPALAALAVTKRCKALNAALTPSTDTKGAYIGEVKFPAQVGVDGEGVEIVQDVTIPWTATKQIMAMILGHAAMIERSLAPVTKRPEAETDWAWHASRDGETYDIGPHASREEVIAAAVASLGSNVEIHVLEGTSPRLRFDAEHVIEQLLDTNDELYAEADQADRTGSAEAIAQADRELQILLDTWLEMHRHTFTNPTTFASRRNAEVVAPGPAADQVEA